MAAPQQPTPTDKSADAGPGPSTANGAQNGEKKLEHLGALEEDDEFEEFPAEDWPESSTTLAALTSANAASGTGTGAAGQAQDPSAQLWEDNWDDDDKESPFTQQLRAELQANNDPDAMKM